MTEATQPDRAGSAPVAPAHQLPSRRSLLRGVALAGVATPLVAACGSGSSGGSDDNPEASAGTVLTSTSQVPKGGGVVLDSDGVVVTQPAAGTFKGFSNICTHQGCPVDNVSDGTINCTCHGSKYSIDDGSVVAGPAPRPLPSKKVTVKGAEVTLA
jgi:Rieske Fe-S protein